MRVLHVFTVPVTRNGITMFALQRLPGLRAAGAAVGFVAPGEVEPSLRAEIEAAGARLYVLPQKRPGPAYVRALAALVRRERYDILHAHGNSSSLFFEMLAAFLGGCRARVAHSHNTTCNHIRQDRRLRPFFYKSYTAAAACGRDAGQWLFEDRPFTVLPNAVDGIVTGCILAVGRIVGESAALLYTAGFGLVLNDFVTALHSSSATLTVALYVYANDRGRTDIAFSIASVLMLLTLVINLTAALTGRKLKKNGGTQ